MNDHVIIIAKTGAFKCEHCGKEYQPNYPIPITMLGAMIDAFIKSHEHCVVLGEDDDV